MSAIACRLASPWVTAVGAGESIRFGPADAHIGSCLRCQAAVVRHRRLGRALTSLAGDAVAAPTSFRSATPEPSTQWHQPLVIAGAAAAVALAGVVGARRMLAH